MSEKNSFDYYINLSIKNLSSNYDENISNNIVEMFQKFENITLIGVGSSYNAALTAQPIMQNHLGKTVSVYYPRTFNKYYKPLQNTLYVLISQSGESKEVISVAQKLLKNNSKIISLTENKNSSLSQLAHETLLMNKIKEEIPFKSMGFTNTIFQLFKSSGIKLHFLKEFEEKINTLYKKYTSYIQEFINKIQEDSIITVLGENSGIGISGELSLKIKEMGWIHSSSYEIEDFMHGKDAYVSSKDYYIILNNDNDKTFFKKFDTIIKKYNGKDLLVLNNEIPYNSTNYIECIFTHIVLSQKIALLLNKQLKRFENQLRFRDLVKLTKTYG